MTAPISSNGELAKAIAFQPGPVTADVRRAAQGLEAAILQTQALVLPHAADIERQVGQSGNLLERATVTQRDLDEVENEFDANQPKTSQEGSYLAEITLKSLRSLKVSYDRLKAVEDAVWSGQSVDTTIRQDLKGISEIDSQRDRGQLLDSLVKEQLSTAWSAAFEIEQPTRVTMTLGNHSALTQSSTIAELCEALQGLDILGQCLAQLQTRILRELVTPLVSSRSLVSEGYGSELRELRFKQKGDASLIEVVSSIRDLVRFVTHALPSPLEAVSSFLSTFSEALYHRVLQEVVIPSIPRELNKLPPWLSDVRQCASWERGESEDSHKQVLQRFLDDQAGTRWLESHRAEGLLETRSLVFDGWKDWDFRLEETKRPTSSRPEENAIERDDGWGFDDEPSILPANEDGWDFDDLAPIPTDSIPAPSVKPAREAKRLGKKLSSKHASASQEALLNARELQRAPTPSAPPLHPEEAVAAPKSSVRVSVATSAALSLLGARLRELQDIESLR
ncbi:hypothetical protein A1Q2_07978 [Trichosporon asahii var. asahii CBS 8904]|uniref:Uncharacterized protein n=1 Tax=Trichosporon asahii var. asahii (strain CBS 8904) TaxID=1220162 RepID=K1V1H5_TRIAC|nr:hypothetical protein A1Q2_07978 [Trichosporon asahii var. asahii CBS 8904]